MKEGRNAPMDIIGAILWPIKWAIELILVSFHWLFTSLGMDPNAGATWVLAIAGLVVALGLLVDDSIVRGTTSREIVQMAREAGAKKVIFASAAPPVRFPNVYGIDMPTRDELIASGRTDDEICAEIGADALFYQDIEDMKRAVRDLNPKIQTFDASCFDGHYITGDVTTEYLDRLEYMRKHPEVLESGGLQMNLGYSANQ